MWLSIKLSTTREEEGGLETLWLPTSSGLSPFIIYRYACPVSEGDGHRCAHHWRWSGWINVRERVGEGGDQGTDNRPEVIGMASNRLRGETWI